MLAVDGIPYPLALSTWRHASIEQAESVFPTTSATAWTTALTGASVDEHGIPGVVFTVGDELIDVYSYTGPLGEPPASDLFSDASQRGYTPIAILGDLETTNCTWRDQLVHRAQQVRGVPFFAPGGCDARVIVDRLVAAVTRELASHAGPCLVWCFLDTDRYIHHHGYDASVVEFLERIDATAYAWSREHVVVAHSDHGLVRTRHDPEIAAVLDRVIAQHGCKMGGAGRTRWLYVDPTAEVQVRERLTRELPSSIAIRSADTFFAPGSVARSRVGAILLIAQGDSFLASDGYTYEHGSREPHERCVPIAEWT
ncbi:MAG TPA: alkaline phosphatase family protein [Kofleriaceae bacterium]